MSEKTNLKTLAFYITIWKYQCGNWYFYYVSNILSTIAHPNVLVLNARNFLLTTN